MVWVDEDGNEIASSGHPIIDKALCDEFFYAVKLRSGELIEFTHAKDLIGEYVTLCGGSEKYLGFANADRGVCVHITDIAWAVDAPHGS